MRTTPTLDPDVAAALERWKEAHGLSLKAAVKEAIRRGRGGGVPVILVDVTPWCTQP